MVLFPLRVKAFITVGSESNCISRDRGFDSGLARFNSFVEIDHGIISTAPASIQFQATIGPPAKLDSDGVVLEGRYKPNFTCLLGYIPPPADWSVSVTSESITKVQTKKCGYGN